MRPKLRRRSRSGRPPRPGGRLLPGRGPARARCRSRCPVRRRAARGCGSPPTGSPRPHSPPRGCESGTARSASAAVMITMGSTSTASVRPPAMTERPPVKTPDGLDEDGESEDPVDDRRHSGQIADVHIDEAGQAVVAGVLLDVDGGCYSQREGQHGDESSDHERSLDGLPHPGLGRDHQRCPRSGTERGRRRSPSTRRPPPSPGAPPGS